MSNLVALAVSAMLAFTPEKLRPEEGSAGREIYNDLANDISSAVQAPFDGLPFEGSAGQEATVIALAAIAATESQYRPEVRTCKIKGDGGASISAFQLLQGPTHWTFSVKEICSTPPLAAKLAIRVLNWYRKQSVVPLHLFQGYATGWHTRTYYPSTKQYQHFASHIRTVGIKISRREGHLYAELPDPVVVSSTDGENLRTNPVDTK